MSELDKALNEFKAKFNDRVKVCGSAEEVFAVVENSRKSTSRKLQDYLGQNAFVTSSGKVIYGK